MHPDADFECMGVLMEHSQDVKCVAWHPKEEVSRKLSEPCIPAFPYLLSMTDSSVAQILASASYDDTIKLYLDDPSDDWFCASTLTGHGSTVWTLAWEPENGNYLASGSDDQTIRIWRRQPDQGELKFQCVAELKGHDRSVYSISWAKAPAHVKTSSLSEGQRDMGWIASTGGDGTVIIWQMSVSVPISSTSTILTLYPRRPAKKNRHSHVLSSRLSLA